MGKKYCIRNTRAPIHVNMQDMNSILYQIVPLEFCQIFKTHHKSKNYETCQNIVLVIVFLWFTQLICLSTSITVVDHSQQVKNKR